MRVYVLVLSMLVVAPLRAQETSNLPLSEDVLTVIASQQAPQRPPVGPSPASLAAAADKLRQQQTNYGNHAQLQAAIDRTIAGTYTLFLDLDSTLLSSAARAGGEEYTQKLIGSLKSIQIRMFDVGMVGGSPADVRSKIQPIRDSLKAPQWARYALYSSRPPGASVSSLADGTDEIEIWSGRDGDRQTGVFLLSVDKARIFTMNVAGSIRPDELVSLSGKLGIPDLRPKLDIRLDAPTPRTFGPVPPPPVPLSPPPSPR